MCSSSPSATQQFARAPSFRAPRPCTTFSPMAIVSDAETPKDAEPKATFDVLPLSAEVRSAVADLGYVHPTPVQRAVFESAARGKDLVVQAAPAPARRR